MTRFAPGIYQLINIDNALDQTREVIVDNEKMIVGNHTSLTILVRNVLLATESNEFVVHRLSGCDSKILGNASRWAD